MSHYKIMAFMALAVLPDMFAWLPTMFSPLVAICAMVFIVWKTNIHNSAWADFITVVELSALAGLYMIVRYPQILIPNLAPWWSITALICRLAWATALLLPLVLWAVSIARIQQHNSELEQKQIQIDLLLARMEASGQSPAADDIQDFGLKSVVACPVSAYGVQNFDIWYAKFANWAYSQFASLASDAVPFPWPEWVLHPIMKVMIVFVEVYSTGVAICEMIYKRALVTLTWLLRTAGNVSQATQAYVVSWHFVEHFLWAVFVNVLTVCITACFGKKPC